MSRYAEAIEAHYARSWGSRFDAIAFDKGPVRDLPPDFRITRFPPRTTRELWTYATVCMSTSEDAERIELHMFCPERSEGIVELLTAAAHFHRTCSAIGLHRIVNFGLPWMEGSSCPRGLISLPYLDGPSLEWLHCGRDSTRFLWVVPVTVEEAEYARKHGIEALEARLEEANLNYADPRRPSVI